MNSQIRNNMYRCGSTVICAGVLLQANVVAASEMQADLQARHLLFSTIDNKPDQFDRPFANTCNAHQTQYLDAQALARQMILGEPTARAVVVPISPLDWQASDVSPVPIDGNRPAYSDTQQLARRMILGSPASESPRKPLRVIYLTQAPLVIRVSKDEFRIAFAIHADRCGPTGCIGVIPYKVQWKTEDGTVYQEVKQVSYVVAAGVDRSIIVDRQYFDTAEGQHTTDIVRVKVD